MSLKKRKKDKIENSNRTKASFYGKKLKLFKVAPRKLIDENLFNKDNLVINNVYDDDRIDYGLVKNIKEEDEISEFARDDDDEENKLDFIKDIDELQKNKK